MNIPEPWQHDAGKVVPKTGSTNPEANAEEVVHLLNAGNREEALNVLLTLPPAHLALTCFALSEWCLTVDLELLKLWLATKSPGNEPGHQLRT